MEREQRTKKSKTKRERLNTLHAAFPLNLLCGKHGQIKKIEQKRGFQLLQDEFATLPTPEMWKAERASRSLQEFDFYIDAFLFSCNNKRTEQTLQRTRGRRSATPLRR